VVRARQHTRPQFLSARNTCVQVQLVQARSRVSPLKQLTIPRLALLAAMIEARLAVSVKKETEQGNPSLFVWGDSSTVIA